MYLGILTHIPQRPLTMAGKQNCNVCLSSLKYLITVTYENPVLTCHPHHKCNVWPCQNSNPQFLFHIHEKEWNPIWPHTKPCLMHFETLSLKGLVSTWGWYVSDRFCYLIHLIKYLFDWSIQSQFICLLLGLTEHNGPPMAATVDLNDISNNCSSLRPVTLYCQMLQKEIPVISFCEVKILLKYIWNC